MKSTSMITRTALALILAAWAIGCDEGSLVGVQNPQDEVGNQPLQFIQLPPSHGLKKIVTASQLITKDKGGVLSLDYSYEPDSGKFDEVRIKMTLTFPPNSVNQDMLVTVTLDDRVLLTNVDLNFSPSPVTFNEPADLDYEVWGIDLTGLSANDAKLYYNNKSAGRWDPVQGQKVNINRNKGYIRSRGAKIPHFSRYAFCR